jgi:hypothetical protein
VRALRTCPSGLNVGLPARLCLLLDLPVPLGSQPLVIFLLIALYVRRQYLRVGILPAPLFLLAQPNLRLACRQKTICMCLFQIFFGGGREAIASGFNTLGLPPRCFSSPFSVSRLLNHKLASGSSRLSCDPVGGTLNLLSHLPWILSSLVDAL